MTGFFKKLTHYVKTAGQNKKLIGLLKDTSNSKDAPKGLAQAFRRITYKPIRKQIFKRLKKVSRQLHFIDDIYPALAPGIIPARYQEDFWIITIGCGLDYSDYFSIIKNSDIFFAEKAYKIVERKFRKGRISKDRMRRYSTDIMATRLEFASRFWLILKPLYPSLDDLNLIDTDQLHTSFPLIGAEIRQMKQKLQQADDILRQRIAEMEQTIKELQAI